MVERHDGGRGPLAAHARGFSEELALLGYRKPRAAAHLELLADLSSWLEDEGRAPAELGTDEVTRFLATRPGRGHRDLVTPVGAAPLIEYLTRLGVIPTPVHVVPEGPAKALLERYRDYLTNERGLVDRSVDFHEHVAHQFVTSVQVEGSLDWASVSAVDVTRFVVASCQGKVGAHAPKFVPALRSFLRFALLEGCINLPLAQAVPSVAGWRMSSLPRGIGHDEVTRLLDSCDRDKPAGRRDYAVLTLFIRLGLRAGEVAAMGLDDLDWRAGELTVHGKGRRDEKLPLPHDVGEVIADYLRHGRPPSTSRSVFLRLYAPYRGLSVPAVIWAVYNACDRTGLPRFGAHRLRHTAASDMLRAGASLAEIGAVLRHRSSQTTAIYAKVDSRSLGTLARPWPEGVQ
jgi:integrase/recombinase XerD